MEIKQYKPLALVFYMDWNGNRNALPLDDNQRQSFKEAIEQSKMIELDGVIINTYDIKEIRPAHLTTELEKYYYSRTWQERSFLTQRARTQSKDRKIHPIEWFWELLDQKAIEKMEALLDGMRSPKETKPEEKLDSNPLTPEKKVKVKEQFQSLKEYLSLKK